MDDFNKALGEWMSARREAAGVSQDSVGRQLGFEQPTMSKIESGRRRVTVEELLLWAEAVALPSAVLAEKLGELRSEFFASDSLWDEVS